MQELLVIIIIAAVLIWLGLRLFRACRSGGTCKGCPSCGGKCPPADPEQDQNCG